ncbi:MAG: zinc-binding dehydrogenase [Bacteroidetes bacterium]|nr:zinc-binding dehydrogenase [Bacteroidota bacterium]
MKAIRKYEAGIKKFRVENLPALKPGPNEVLVEIEYAGICGTDLHIYHDTYKDAPPMTIGHEFSGRIIELGDSVSGFSLGDRVVSETNAVYCGECALCKAGRFCLCDSRLALGQQTDGVFTEQAVLMASNLHKLPDNVTMLEAALAEPLACVVHAAMERSTIKAGDTVLVSGPGSIGLMAVSVAKLSGAKVLLTGTTADAARLALGLELGADKVVDVFTEDIQSAVTEFTKGQGIDVVLECSGVALAVAAGITALKKCGIFTQIGLFAANVTVDMNAVCFKEINYQGCLSKTNWSWRRTIEILGTKKLNLEKLVSHIFTLDEWEKAFSIAENMEGMKIIFKP